MNKIENKIFEKNKEIWNYLNFSEIKKNNFIWLVKKIINTNLWDKFNLNFPENNKYYQELSFFIKENIIKKENFLLKDYETLYIKIFQIFYKDSKSLWFRDKIKYNMIWLDENWKKIDYYPDYKEIQKLLNIIFTKFNNKENNKLFERFYFISLEILNKIHPFPNNNFAYTSIVLDLLLIKYNLLPINIKKTFKVNNLFYPDLEIFKKIILERYKKYKY